jgi:hypothetical protein
MSARYEVGPDKVCRNLADDKKPSHGNEFRSIPYSETETAAYPTKAKSSRVSVIITLLFTVPVICVAIWMAADFWWGAAFYAGTAIGLVSMAFYLDSRYEFGFWFWFVSNSLFCLLLGSWLGINAPGSEGHRYTPPQWQRPSFSIHNIRLIIPKPSSVGNVPPIDASPEYRAKWKADKARRQRLEELERQRQEGWGRIWLPIFLIIYCVIALPAAIAWIEIMISWIGNAIRYFFRQIQTLTGRQNDWR